MDILGRYYTKESFSELLVSNIESKNPKSVLELGVGGGSLIRAAHNRWKNANFIAADIDTSSIKKINKALPFIKVIHANGLNTNIEKKIFIDTATIDVAICNPPYLNIRDKSKFKKLLHEANLKECNKLNKLTSDIIFLAQNIRLLKEKGELGIILPDTILTGQDFQHFRSSLLNNHKIKALIELPDRIFSKTEAKTHIVLIEKGEKCIHDIPLFIADRTGSCIDQISVAAASLERRMDYSFHKSDIRYKGRISTKKLGDFNYQIKRGNKTHAELKDQKRNFIHSTSYRKGDILRFGKIGIRIKKRFVIAEKGDLIITRVGRGCVGKAALIKQGEVIISDCIYVIKSEKKVINSLYRFLNSNDGEGWIRSNSHGVCARVLNLSDIKNIPI